MKSPFLRWTLGQEAYADLESMKKRLFWQQIALIEGRHNARALQEKIDFTTQTLEGLKKDADKDFQEYITKNP